VSAGFHETFLHCSDFRLHRCEPVSATKTSAPISVRCRFVIAYRPPYEWDRCCRFLAARAIPGVETVFRWSLPADHCDLRRQRLIASRLPASTGSMFRCVSKHAALPADHRAWCCCVCSTFPLFRMIGAPFPRTRCRAHWSRPGQALRVPGAWMASTRVARDLRRSHVLRRPDCLAGWYCPGCSASCDDEVSDGLGHRFLNRPSASRQRPIFLFSACRMLRDGGELTGPGRFPAPNDLQQAGA